MMPASYYVRIQGRVLGPFTPERLLAMKARRQLYKFHEISADKLNWYPASDFADLFPETAGKSSTERLARADEEEPAPIAMAPPRRHRVLPVLLTVGIVCLLIAGAGIWIWQKNKSGPLGGNSSSTGETNSGNAISGMDEEELAKAIGLVACGVEITAPKGDRWVEGLGTGTCFSISPDGHLLTNRHVLEEIQKLKRAPILKDIAERRSMRLVPKVWVFLNKKRYEAQVLHISDDFDLGILKIDVSTPAYFRLSRSEKVHRNVKVVACGFPGAARVPLSEEEFMHDLSANQAGNDRKRKIDDYFMPHDLVFSSTSGTVSRMDEREGGRIWIQHDASINPGNSGGPLIGPEGVVVGINTLGSLKGTGIYWSLALPQLKPEIEKHAAGVVWK